MSSITIPGANHSLLLGGASIDPVWYEKLKFLELIQPLSDIDNSALEAEIALKSNILRTINDQTGTSYTFALTDSGKYCRFTNASAVTVTVPPYSSVAFPEGTQIDGVQGGAGKVTFAQGSGVTINSLNSYKALAGRYAAFTLVHTATQNTWDLAGSLVP